MVLTWYEHYFDTSKITHTILVSSSRGLYYFLIFSIKFTLQPFCVQPSMHQVNPDNFPSSVDGEEVLISAPVCVMHVSNPKFVCVDCCSVCFLCFHELQLIIIRAIVGNSFRVSTDLIYKPV